MVSEISLKILLLLLLFMLAGCRETILHNLTEQEANRVFVALARSGIEAEKVLEGTSWAVAVPTGAVPKALTALEDRRILQNDRSAVERESSSVFQSREERQASVQHQLSSQIENTLERFGGVVEARVHLYLQSTKNLGLTPAPERQSASVLLVAGDVADGLEQEVQRLVAGATGLGKDDITVVFTKRDVALTGTTEPTANLFLPPDGSSESSILAIWTRRADRIDILRYFSVVALTILGALITVRRRRLAIAERMLKKLKTSSSSGASSPEFVAAASGDRFEADSADLSDSGESRSIAAPVYSAPRTFGHSFGVAMKANLAERGS